MSDKKRDFMNNWLHRKARGMVVHTTPQQSAGNALLRGLANRDLAQRDVDEVGLEGGGDDAKQDQRG